MPAFGGKADITFSYWGVVLPEHGSTHSPIAVRATPEAGGQVMANEAGGISETDGWRAIEYLVSALLPTAERSGVRLACHPHDPAYPPGGLNGVHHVLGSLDGMRRFVALAPESPSHGQRRIFMVHFRNIVGGYLDFREAMPDEGSVEMLACIRAYREVGYDGILCPDHVPFSELDPDRERFFSFCLGYTKALLQAA
jgi:mannonate dehydratase